MKLFSGLLAIGALGLSLGLTAPALAQGSGENFTIDQSCGGSGFCSEAGGVLTDLDRISFTYTARIDQSNDQGGDGPGGGNDLLNGDPFVEKGFAIWQGYVRDDNSTPAGEFLNADYQVYMVFTATGTAAFDGEGISATFNSFVIDIYVSDNTDTALTVPASTAGDVLNGGQAIGSGLGVNADDRLIATATLISIGEAELEAGLANGDYEIQVTDLGLELFGESFFTSPDPFYTVMNFAGNTGTVAPPGSVTAPFSSVATGDGQMFFQVPEPGTLGLLGAGLVGAAAFLRRRKAAKAA